MKSSITFLIIDLLSPIRHYVKLYSKWTGNIINLSGKHFRLGVNFTNILWAVFTWESYAAFCTLSLAWSFFVAWKLAEKLLLKCWWKLATVFLESNSSNNNNNSNNNDNNSSNSNSSSNNSNNSNNLRDNFRNALFSLPLTVILYERGNFFLSSDEFVRIHSNSSKFSNFETQTQKSNLVEFNLIDQIWLNSTSTSTKFDLF